MAMTNFLEDKMLNHIFKNINYTAPTKVYAGLFTTTPTETTNGTEVAGNGYVRQPITFATATNGTIVNSGDVIYPSATGAWGTIKGCAFFDAQIGGNMLFYADLQVQKIVGLDDQLVFKANNLTVTLD